MRRNVGKYLRWAILLLLLSLVLVIVAFCRYITTPGPAFDEPMLVEIKPGTGFKSLARHLEQRGMISQPVWWIVYAVITSKTGKIQAGEYWIEPGSSPQELLDLFVNGEVATYRLTLIEGLRFSEILTVLAQQEKLEHRLAGLSQQQVMEQLGRPEEHPEGRFFPDSYQYVAGGSDLEILHRAYERLQQVLAEEWQERAENLPYDNPYEALIMASIIEKETGTPEEREEIAGVFVRRLQKGMRLQSDPTVIYGLGDRYRGNLTREHLRQRTTYNTYVIKGLPPTPIAAAGRAAIHAALHPAPGKSLYFVARGDGTHVFSDTLEEHMKAVKRFQLEQKRAGQYRSAPQPKAGMP